jgi:hypothetical protein
MTRKNPRLLVGTLIAVFALSSACATVIRRNTQRIPVTSAPIGARVSLNGTPQGATPLEIKIPRGGKGQVIRIEYDGYDPVEIRPERKLSGGPVIANFLLGFIPAVIPAVAYNMAHDEDPNVASMSFLIWGAGALAVGGLLTGLDAGHGPGYELRPREIIVTLAKTKGQPMTRTVLLEPGAFENVAWIRVRRD